MKHILTRVLCIAFILAVACDLAWRGWQALDLAPWQVSMIAWPVLFFTVALVLAFGYALVLLADARAAIARRMSPIPTSEEVPHGNASPVHHSGLEVDDTLAAARGGRTERSR